MKPFIPALLAALMLCGCVAAPQSPTETTSPPVTEAAPAAPVGFYDPGSELEARTDGALTVYPLYRSDAYRIVTMDSGVLLFSGETRTTLTLLAGEDLYVKASANLDCFLPAGDPSVQVSEKGVTYYDSNTRELVFLDASLKEGTRFSVPGDMAGTPALSANRKSLYYCTENALRVMELDTGLTSLIREISGSSHRISGLHCADMIVACQVTDAYGEEQTVFVSSENGRTLWETFNSLSLATRGSRYFARNLDGIYPEYLTGAVNDPVLLLDYNGFETNAYPVLALDGALLLTGVEQTTLEFLELSTGRRTSFLECPGILQPLCVTADAAGGSILMLCYDESYECNTICRWTLSRSTIADDRRHLTERPTKEHPDLAALEACETTAAELGQRHGVQIHVWQDALSEDSGTLSLEPEHQAQATAQWLEELDRLLSVYPSDLLGQLAGPSGAPLQISLVRSFHSQAPAEELCCLLHLDSEADPHLFIALDEDWQADFQHQLFHVIETHVLTTCSAYDSWNSLNPKSFRYTLDYSAEISDALQPVLEEGSFINLYATSFPREDRAMTMLAALEPDNEACFQNPTMQSKLKLLCSGIRKAFGYKKSPEVFLWEQYLK